jgi:hypothetical protein
VPRKRKDERAAIEEFLKVMHAHTVSLVRLDPSSLLPVFLSDPNGGHLLASGVIWADSNRLLLLCAGHTLEAGTWGLETGALDLKQRRTLVLKLAPAMLEGQDFGWVDLKSVLGSIPAEARPSTLPAYRGSIGQPKAGEDYGFAAANRVELVKGCETADLHRDPGFEFGMRFDGRHSDGRYVFKLAKKHQGDDYYFGSSGAPIADRSGAIVSLVSGGSEEADVIYGVPLAELVAKLPPPTALLAATKKDLQRPKRNTRTRRRPTKAPRARKKKR